jgi:hypothetical protein
MLFFIVIIVLLQYIVAFEPSCSSCKYFIPNVKTFNDLGLCKMFKDSITHKGKQIILPNYAIHCRQNENLCGISGFLYEPIDSIDENQLNEVNADDESKLFKNKIFFELEELNNKCCGEINEKDEIEELEKEFSEIYKKIQKHNKKNIYNKNKDLYKLFKVNKNI